MSKSLFITTELVAFAAVANLAMAEVATQRLVVHVVDYANAGSALPAAERLAAQIYRRIGVNVTWQTGHRPVDLDDGARHLEVVILADKMTENKCRDDGLPDSAFGAAVQPAQRASVFFDRAARYAQSSGSRLAVVLAMVMAHEMGHLLLPAGTGHSSEGLMRPHWAGRIQWVPRFERRQGETIQQLLSPPTEMAVNAR